MSSSPIQSVCVYCGSSPGNDPAYLEAGKTLGRSLGEAGLRLVYGGGTKGIMGAVAQGTISTACATGASRARWRVAIGTTPRA